MGVKGCYRGDPNGPLCPSIMCDVLLAGHYICHECLDEFQKWRETWGDETGPWDVDDKIKEFFASKPRAFVPYPDLGPDERRKAIDERIKDLTREG